MAPARARHHLTIADKNRLRRHHRQHPELTQEQLREWAYAAFGQWVARSTVGHIVRAPEEASANPQATRFQSGRYPDMERELFAQVAARAAQLGLDARRLDAPVLSDAELWTRANEILKRTRGSDESVSAAWVHRFKKRHGLHRSQLRRAAADAEADAEPALEAASGSKRAAAHQLTDTTSPRKRPATAASTAASASATAAAAAAAPGNRPHFVSAEDILLLTQVLDVKPWAAAYAMDGWQQVVDKLRADCAFRLEKTAGACQARVNLLLSHMKSGNMTALRKSGTKDEFERKCALLREVAAQMEVHERMQQGGDNVGVLAVSGLEPTAVVGPTAVSPINAGLVDLAQERERMAQRRLELMERKMERELAAQKRHSQEQVERLEKLHREQQQVQQEQHAQLLATIRQQQAMMLEFIKSLAPVGAQYQENTQPQRL